MRVTRGAMSLSSSSHLALIAYILLLISGAAWAGAFLGFAVLYGPMLCKGRAPRPPSTPLDETGAARGADSRTPRGSLRADRAIKSRAKGRGGNLRAAR